MPKSITVVEAANLQKNGATLVDVREITEFQEVSAPGAVNVPLSLIQKIGPEAYRNAGVNLGTEGLMIICRSGGRSAMACSGLGENAINVDGGMLAWQAAGLPVSQ